MHPPAGGKVLDPPFDSGSLRDKDQGTMTSAENAAIQLVGAIWSRSGMGSVGATELTEIQRQLSEHDGAMLSPASIARVLADEGATLRHPEVLECDATWRAGLCEEAATIEGLESAFIATRRWEEARRKLMAANDQPGIARLMVTVREAREEYLLRARGAAAAEPSAEEAAEIAEWLRVWLSAPDLFTDWLALRIAAPDFLKRFGGISPRDS
jgi:hypothetical protein